MSHGDSISRLPEGFETIARTDSLPIAAMADRKRNIYGFQFHPEVVHTPAGKDIIANFLFHISGCTASWDMRSFVERNITEIRQRVGDGKVLCAVSGGVDSSVLATLIYKAIGDQLECIFVDNGVLRKNEAQEVIETFRNDLCIDLHFVDATDRFLEKLAGVEDPEAKRKIIGSEFVNVFQEKAKKLGKIDFLAQGTLYPDVIESGGVSDGPAAVIKPKPGANRTVAGAFQGRGQGFGKRIGVTPKGYWTASFPGSRACNQNPWRRDARTTQYFKRSRCHFSGRTEKGGYVRQSMASLRRSASHQVSGRYGR